MDTISFHEGITLARACFIDNVTLHRRTTFDVWDSVHNELRSRETTMSPLLSGRRRNPMLHGHSHLLFLDQIVSLVLSLYLSFSTSFSLSLSLYPSLSIPLSLSHAGRTTICRHLFSLSLSIPLSLSLSLSPTLAGQQSAGIQRGRQPKCRDHHIHLRLRRGHCDRVVAGDGRKRTHFTVREHIYLPLRRGQYDPVVAGDGQKRTYFLVREHIL